ncbi:shikimate kinase [Tepidibacter hydrothermalis]|uniref:Shikimate kinase n=1 Tax=Tepidibacter hydrothermalis TaxID=3036126 RepID=A0ABY8E707_9FIRM|nr:shikimate kinase [Tepidibacter hydrothermalis]WFD08677.1 shikimate kinase [Tepidibacter hydrothermalis]
MLTNIIHIVGASGSGTTTLGKAIEHRYGYTHLDVDDYYWLPTDPPFITPRKLNQRVKLLEEDIKKYKKCVITGSLCGWGDCFISKFDLIIRVVTPTKIRIKRLRQRELQRFGNRILPNGDMFNKHMEFIQWARKYDTGDTSMRSKKLHDEWIKSILCKQIVIDGTISTDIVISKIDELFVK